MIRAFIVAWVALQIALPAGYYLFRNDDVHRYDERWAWRMFSPIRAVRCDVDFTADGKRVSTSSEFHTAWIGLAERGRPSVIEEMAERLCEVEGAPVTVRQECKHVDGSKHLIHDGSKDWCAP